MLELINELITSVMESQWAYAAIFLVAALDAFFPVVPSETTVIAAAAVAATGGQSLGWVILLAAAGAFLGDHVSYLIGRKLGAPAINRLLGGERGRTARQRAQATLRSRGGLMIVAARFVPGGRTATTLTAGTLRYPLGRFIAFDVVAAIAWAMYAGLIGYWAGGVFRGNHLLAVAVGIGVSIAISVIVEAGRFLVRRRRGGRSAAASGTGPESRVTSGVG